MAALTQEELARRIAVYLAETGPGWDLQWLRHQVAGENEFIEIVLKKKIEPVFDIDAADQERSQKQGAE